MRTGGAAHIDTAIVLAAGKSTRIQSAAGGRPKPLVEVGGSTVLERNLRQLADAGICNVWINLHYEPQQIRDRIGDGSAYGVRVNYSWEPALLGTAGAVRNLRSELGAQAFLVVYGDNLVGLDLRQMIERHRRSEALATIAVFDRERIPNTGLAGGRVVVDADGWVREFREGPAASDSPLVNAGVYVIEPELVAAIPAEGAPDFGHDVFPSVLAAGGRLAAYFVDGYCLGIDTPEGLARATALLADLETPQRLTA